MNQENSAKLSTNWWTAKANKTIENSRIEFNSKSNDSDEVCPNFKHKRWEFSCLFSDIFGKLENGY